MLLRLRRPLAALGGIVLLLVLGGVIWLHGRSSLSPASLAAPKAAAQNVNPAPAAPAAPADTQEQIKIPARSTFAAACARLSLPQSLVHQLVRAARPVFNLGRVQAGNTLTLVRAATGEIKSLSYRIDDNHWLWLRAQPVQAAGLPAAAGAVLPASTAAPVPADHEHWTATVETVPYETRVVGYSGTVDSSLFQAVEDAGAQDQLALDMAQIFGWDLDFYTDPRSGDVFRVLVEENFLNGKFSHYGQIVAAEYVNDGHPYEAVRFHDGDGEVAYYRPDGKPMKREFLHSPLKFVALRVTSPFSRHRYHPILKSYRAHLGVDYGAPIGTPVQAIGSGTVVWAARKGEDGNMVELRHANGYLTFYLHLSRILVHRGDHVAQGQTIGRVGMTGLATGPHLDFRIEHNGRFENFQALRESLPPAAPVSAKLMPAFRKVTAEFMPRLAALHPAGSAPATETAAAPASSAAPEASPVLTPVP